MNSPIFLLAAPFCGVSRLAAMLGCHPQLYALPQLHLFMADTIGELLDIFELGQGMHADGVLRAVAQLEFGAQSDENVVLAREWLRQRAALRSSELLKLFAARVAPRHLVIPEADSPLRPGDLRRLHEQVPDARLVHVVRHPWSQGVALAAHLRERLFVPRDYCDHSVRPARIDPQIPWLRANLNIDRLLSLTSPDARLRLPSESLDQNPKEALSGICGWLRIETGEAAIAEMQRPELWTFASCGPGLAPYGLEEEAPENQAAESAEPPSLDRPLPWLQSSVFFADEVIRRARDYRYS